eukprot:scaffold1054_cov116-Isochrysis_galbana.AAC.14
MLAHNIVSLGVGVGMLRGLLVRAKLLFAIVDLMSVNGTAFRPRDVHVRVACETLTGVFWEEEEGHQEVCPFLLRRDASDIEFLTCWPTLILRTT